MSYFIRVRVKGGIYKMLTDWEDVINIGDLLYLCDNGMVSPEGEFLIGHYDCSNDMIAHVYQNKQGKEMSKREHMHQEAMKQPELREPVIVRKYSAGEAEVWYDKKFLCKIGTTRISYGKYGEDYDREMSLLITVCVALGSYVKRLNYKENIAYEESLEKSCETCGDSKGDKINEQEKAVELLERCLMPQCSRIEEQTNIRQALALLKPCETCGGGVNI